MKTIRKIEYEGKEYPVWYRHEHDYERKHGNKVVVKGRTVAFIKFDDGVTNFEAYAECSVKDIYIKARGRAIAGGRLQRAAIDNEYLQKKVAKTPPQIALVIRENSSVAE